MKKVLFITIYFREYVCRIKNAVETQMNAKVDVIFTEYQRPGAIWAIEKICGKNIAVKTNQKYQKKRFLRIPENTYDYIFVLVGRGINSEAFRQFTKQQRRAKKILYLWDDIKRIDEYNEIKDVFDDILSFDLADCVANNLRFLPLFFCDDYRYNNEKKDIDFSCVGSLHTYRENLLADLQNALPEDKYKWYAILTTTKFHMFKLKFLGRSSHDFVKHTELSISETAKISKRSKVVIDMPHLSQKGLSMRIIESLAAHAKIITTNKEICKYDFYNSENVCVIDVNKPVIPDNFLSSEYIEIEEKIVEKYSINQWTKALFDVMEDNNEDSCYRS